MDKVEHYKKRVYYAQNREDLILRAFFPDIDTGVYVDIGAYDPDFESVTKYFYEHGWGGMNVEPQLENYKRFVSKRPKDINVRAGVAAKRGTMVLRSYANQGLSTFSASMKKQYQEHPDNSTATFEDVPVQVLPLKELLKENNLTKIHFMKVDVEGLEYEVLNSNDWEVYRPEVLCIESNHIAQDWHALLETVGYKMAFKDGLNDYYCDSRTDRQQHFDYVKSIVLEKGGGLRIDDFESMLELKKERDELAKYARHLLEEVNIRNKRIMELEAAAEAHERTRNKLKKGSKRVARKLKKQLSRGAHA
ncbi:MAG: FkbM family methyltransferase [Candidatus Saccharibacteria bacterium]|nr:FkbM family methyltransferase [Candidatus Saccharibacteria bacterium]